MNHFEFEVNESLPTFDDSQFEELDAKFAVEADNNRPFFVINRTPSAAIMALRFVSEFENSKWYEIKPPIGQTCNATYPYDCVSGERWRLLCYLTIDKVYNIQLALIDINRKWYIATGYKIFIRGQDPGGYTVFPLKGTNIIPVKQ